MKCCRVGNFVTVYSCFVLGQESMFPNAAVLSTVLQGAVSAACNVYNQFILWFCLLVHSKHTHTCTQDQLFHLTVATRNIIMFKHIHCHVSCLESTHCMKAVMCAQHRMWLQVWVDNTGIAFDRWGWVDLLLLPPQPVRWGSVMHLLSHTWTRDTTLSSY